MSLGYQFSRYGMSVLEVLHETCVMLSQSNYSDLDFGDEDYVDSLLTSTFDTYAAVVTNAGQ